MKPAPPCLLLLLQGEPLKQPLSKEYDRLLKELREREAARFGELCPPCPLDLDDVRLCAAIAHSLSLSCNSSFHKDLT